MQFTRLQFTQNKPFTSILLYRKTIFFKWIFDGCWQFSWFIYSKSHTKPNDASIVFWKRLSCVGFIELGCCKNGVLILEPTQSQFLYAFQRSKYINWREEAVNGPFDRLYGIITSTSSCGMNKINGTSYMFGSASLTRWSKFDEFILFKNSLLNLCYLSLPKSEFLLIHGIWSLVISLLSNEDFHILILVALPLNGRTTSAPNVWWVWNRFLNSSIHADFLYQLWNVSLDLQNRYFY